MTPTPAPSRAMRERAENITLTFGLTAEIGERRVDQVAESIARALEQAVAEERARCLRIVNDPAMCSPMDIAAAIQEA